MNPPFEVDYKARLEQSRAAIDAVRLPKLGYRQYRVYDDEPKSSTSPPIIVSIGGHNIYVDEWSFKKPTSYTVKWLKPKTVTLLRIQNKRIEEHT